MREDESEGNVDTEVGKTAALLVGDTNRKEKESDKEYEEGESEEDSTEENMRMSKRNKLNIIMIRTKG
jgi:hypothetical protein